MIISKTVLLKWLISEEKKGVEEHKINGAGLNYVLHHSMEICDVDKFLLENLFEEFSSGDKTDLDNTEYTNVLFGVV